MSIVKGIMDAYRISHHKVIDVSPISNLNLVSYSACSCCSMAPLKEGVEIRPSNVLVLADALRAATFHREKIKASKNR